MQFDQDLQQSEVEVLLLGSSHVFGKGLCSDIANMVVIDRQECLSYRVEVEGELRLKHLLEFLHLPCDFL